MSEQKSFINTVTVTGADDSVSQKSMVEIQERFPFAEWGILLSASAEGLSRFPSRDWISRTADEKTLRLSGHICGRWIRDICKGNWSIFQERPEFIDYFSRIQLNWHGEKRTVGEEFFYSFPHRQNPIDFIFQLDIVNNHLYERARDNRNIIVSGLFDLSHGAGVLPEKWTNLYPDSFIGYAGGLSPDNLEEQLIELEKVANPGCWIDAETYLRSNNDQQFDLDKVVKFLEIAEPWCNK